MRMRFIAAAGLALASFSHAASAATVVGGSGLLTVSYANQLETWLNATPLYDGSLQFTNIFTRNAGDNSIDFHAAADGNIQTISILSVTGSRSGVTGLIGGFNPNGWSSAGNGSAPDPTRTAFIFNLTTSDLRPLISGSAGQYATYNLFYIGPTFGGGFDIYTNGNLNGGSLNPYSYGNGCGFSCSGQLNLLGGPPNETFTISGLEVFTISETAIAAAVPEPSTWAMIILGFAGVGVMTWRRSRKDGAMVVA